MFTSSLFRVAIIRRSMLADISKRRDYQRDLQMSGSMERMADKLPYILPDYMLFLFWLTIPSLRVTLTQNSFSAFDNACGSS